MKIYTKKGDKGRTRLADGSLHGKNEVVFEVLGEIDELSAWLGLCVTCMKNINSKHEIRNSKQIQILKIQNSKKNIYKYLERIQRELIEINGLIARSKKAKIDIKKEIKWLEDEIDKMEKELPPLTHFVLPGGSELGARLHIARTVCRRAEREIVRCFESSNNFITYFNRLSDYLFTLARRVETSR